MFPLSQTCSDSNDTNAPAHYCKMSAEVYLSDFHPSKGFFMQVIKYI